MKIHFVTSITAEQSIGATLSGKSSSQYDLNRLDLVLEHPDQA